MTGAVATGDGEAFTQIPRNMSGYYLSSVSASVYTAGTTGTTDVQLRNMDKLRDFLSTVITIDSGETSTYTAAAPAVINAAQDDVQRGDRIAIDIDAVSTTAPIGLCVEMEWSRP
jgi:hypothetical protein